MNVNQFKGVLWNIPTSNHDLLIVAKNRPGSPLYRLSEELDLSNINITHHKRKWRKKSINFLSKCSYIIPKPITFFYNQ
jgi:hypothetical protein